jgi:hypothetical protein
MQAMNPLWQRLVFIGLIFLFVAGVGTVMAYPFIAGNLFLPLVYRAANTPTPTPTITRTPTITPTPTLTTVPIITPTPIGSQFTNPGFEQGTTGWVVQSNQGDNVVTNSKAHTGQYSAALGNGTNNRTASIAQQIFVPYDRYTVQYYQLIDSDEICPPGPQRYDYVTIFVNGSFYNGYNICEGISSANWEKWFINLSPFKGSSVVLMLQFTSDGTLASAVYVDDFSFIFP